MKKHKLFISYSHKDEKYKEELLKHLSTLIRNNVISEWHDGKINPGDDWDSVIRSKIDSADIIILLVSPDFISSDYIQGVEFAKAIKKHYHGEALTIPVIIRHCDWQNTPIGRILSLPKDGKPVSVWEDRDQAYFNVIEGIKKIIENNISKENVIRSYAEEFETTKSKLAKFSYEKLEQATGLEDFVEFLKDSKYHPKKIIPTLNSSFYFLGHGASKWTKESQLLEKVIQKIMVNDGRVRIMLFDPRVAEQQFDQEKILKSLLILRKLAKRFNKRNPDFFQIRLYNQLPSFRLAFINKLFVLVGHYKTYTANSNDSPILVFNSSEEWSFYSAFQVLFNDKWNMAQKVEDIWSSLESLYKKLDVRIN